MSEEQVQEAVEVEVPDDGAEIDEGQEVVEVEQQQPEFDEDITHFGPDGPIQEEAEEVAEGEEVVDDGEAAPEPTAGSPALEPKPLEFRAYGKNIQVPGAVEVEVEVGEGQTETQIVMTKAAFRQHIQSRIPDPEKTGQRERELEAQIADLQPDTNETVIRSRVMAERMDGLIELAKTDPDTALQALQNFEGLARTWELEAKNAILEANANRQASTTTSASQEAKVQEWTGIIEGEMGTESPGNVVDIMLTQSGIDLAPADQKLLREYVYDHRGDYYMEATAEHASQFEGINEGDLVRNDPRLIRDLEHQIGLIQRAANVAKAKDVEAANTRKVQGKQVPPTRPAKGKQGGAGSEYVPPKDKEEYHRRMGRP